VIAHICLCASVLSALQVLLPAVTAYAQSSTPESVLGDGRRAFDRARFSEAIEILRAPVEGGAFSGRDLLEAREILARSHIKLGDPSAAVRYFRDNLNQDPNYRPDSEIVPPDEIEVFELAQSEPRDEGSSGSWWKSWYVITGAVVGLGGVLYAILKTDSEEDGPLPVPPDPPTGPGISQPRWSPVSQ